MSDDMSVMDTVCGSPITTTTTTAINTTLLQLLLNPILDLWHKTFSGTITLKRSFLFKNTIVANFPVFLNVTGYTRIDNNKRQTLRNVKDHRQSDEHQTQTSCCVQTILWRKNGFTILELFCSRHFSKAVFHISLWLNLTTTVLKTKVEKAEIMAETE